MATIEQIKAALRSYHLCITGVQAAPERLRKIETADLPCVLVRTGQGTWQHDSTGAMRQDRQFFVECLVEPLTQMLPSTQEELIDQMIDAFADYYYNNLEIAPGCWINMDSITDTGIQVMDFGTRYIGFVFEITIQIRR